MHLSFMASNIQGIRNVLFLISAILFLIAAYKPTSPDYPRGIALGLGFLALGFLVV